MKLELWLGKILKWHEDNRDVSQTEIIVHILHVLTYTISLYSICFSIDSDVAVPFPYVPLM